MSGKWTNLKGKYEKTPLGSMSGLDDPGFLERVEQLKVEFGELPQADLMKAHRVETNEKSELGDKLKETNARIEAIGQLLIDIFNSQGVSSVKTEDSQSLYISVEPHVTVQDREALYAYIESKPELEYLWATNHMTLSSWVKNLLEEGRDSEVPECLKVWLKTSIRSRKS